VHEPAGLTDYSPHEAEGAERLARSGLGSPTQLAGTVGNRAFARLVHEGRVVAHGRALARQESRLAEKAQNGALTVSSWAAVQDDWGVLDDSRALVENAANGATVTLLGKPALDIVVSESTLAEIRRTVRHRMMEILHEWRQSLDAELSSTHWAGSRLDVQFKIRQRLGPLYEAILRGKPADERFEYPQTAPHGAAIVDTALSMAELMGEGGAEDALANLAQDFDAPQRAADAATGLPAKEEWCGAFAYMELAREGLKLPTSVIGNPLLGTHPPAAGNLDGFFLYMPALEVKVGEAWIPLEQHHADRGSKRRYQVLPGGGPEWDTDTKAYQGGKTPRLGMISDLSKLDARPGDIVLIDNAKGTYADHITLCRSYDASTHTLWTIGGNEGAAHPVRGSLAWNLDTNPAPSRIPEGALKDQSRVYAVAGFSVVDYEVHTYRNAKA
jgi:hypothetical protein